MYFKNQTFLVAGLSSSGESATEFLIKRGATVYIYDDVVSDLVQKVSERLQLLGAVLVTQETYAEIIRLCDVLVLSPGIPIDNPLPVAFHKMGKLIIGEEGIAFDYLRATSIAVTGTNGKTTTVSMIDAVLRQAEHKSVTCGNIGNPTIREVENLSFDDYAVVEISSFQLEASTNIRPHVAVITNITEDHLNRHYNMENYIFLKSRLIKNLRENEYAVLNYDDHIVASLATQTKAKVVWVSTKSRTNGAYLDQNMLCYNGESIMGVDNLSLGGIHNIYNALCAIAVAKILSIPNDKIIEGLQNFRGVKHRVEPVDTVNGVSYINDSKGTNIDATMKAIDSITTPCVLLLGGKDKGYRYQSLFEYIVQKNVAHVVLYGENRYQLMESAIASNFFKFSICNDLHTAVKLSSMIAQKGQTVLLSPASASFDAFRNYEERGERFVSYVNELKNEEKDT